MRVLAWMMLAWAAAIVVAAAPQPAGLESGRTAPPSAVGYLVLDLTSGRDVEAAHLDWLDTPVQPGSIAKIATLTAALREGAITRDTRIACTRQLVLTRGPAAPCSHPPLARPPDIAEALAYSCNTFVATVARRLSRAQLSAGHVALGLPPLSANDDLIAAAIGMGEGRVAPRRLVDLMRRAIAGPSAIRDGLKQAAESGTAAAFGQAGVRAFAKTGTSRMRGGQSLGLVAALLPRDGPTHAVVVMVPGGSGADAADIGATLARRATDAGARESAPFVPRIGTPREGADGYDVRSVPLEDYVAQVVAGETLRSTPAAAREAVAVAARSFAWANRGRHRAEGFDLCTLTHCQVVRPAHAEAREAASRTAARVLLADGEVAPVFYSAACGGMLDAMAAIANPVEPGRELAWMKARPDPARVDEPTWSSTLAVRALDGVFKDAGWRGSRLRHLRVEGDAAGRARWVHLEGLEPAVLSVNDFRRLVGQRLGWHLVKSTAFVAERTSGGFELRGRGSGHGVGLCLFGAAAMARRGLDVEQILSAYFEGLTLGRASDPVAAAPAPAVVPPLVAATAPEVPVSVDLRVPESAGRDASAIRTMVVAAIRELARTLTVAPPSRVAIVMHPTAESYRRATGREWWTSAATVWRTGEPTIHTLPPGVLRRQGQLDSTLRHEIVHVLADPGHADRPLWFREGLAVEVSGTRLEPLDGPCPADHEFTRPSSPAALGRAYRRALTCVTRERRR